MILPTSSCETIYHHAQSTLLFYEGFRKWESMSGKELLWKLYQCNTWWQCSFGVMISKNLGETVKYHQRWSMFDVSWSLLKSYWYCSEWIYHSCRRDWSPYNECVALFGTRFTTPIRRQARTQDSPFCLFFVQNTAVKLKIDFPCYTFPWRKTKTNLPVTSMWIFLCRLRPMWKRPTRIQSKNSTYPNGQEHP